MRQENQFGTAFKLVRHARGKTQEDFAQESGRTYISELERGVKQPTIQKIDSLAGPLGIHPITLIFIAYLNNLNESSAEELLELIRAETSSIFAQARGN